ncbi:MAG: 3-phosphoserine/phosphohydroxythreonine transaminase [Bacteroidetes bacterium]|nr:3-phosphoserine/phosphohydroxythreonine transaminase [Bacteroidota bacterium]MBS1740053.1 3-phosphoserine/phosphohydroxythreonine transaminase [Bacteroidota bacterium]
MNESISNHKIYLGAGPAALPSTVLQEASEAVIEYQNSGLSILEIPHRGSLFQNILDESKVLVRELCNLTDDYEVLWLPGGGRMQFCMIPMNFLGDDETAGYIDSGHWAHEAMKYGGHFGKALPVCSSKNVDYSALPTFPNSLPNSLAYLHLTTNNTIYGTQWHNLPKQKNTLIADMSSDIFGTPRSFSHFDVFYAVAQKNLGAAGVTLVVMKKEMLEKTKRILPPMLCYAAHAQKHSVLNTPPVYAIYISLLMLRWTKKKTLSVLHEENAQKAALLYDELDRNNTFYPVVVNKSDRSLMNVCFRTKDDETTIEFSDFCTRNNIAGIKGHRSVGGFRASLYNATPLENVQTLVAVMQEFERRYS